MHIMRGEILLILLVNVMERGRQGEIYTEISRERGGGGGGGGGERENR